MTDQTTLLQLLHDFSSRNRAVRQNALRRARILTSAEMIQLLELYQQQFNSKRMVILSVIAVCITVLLMLLLLFAEWIVPDKKHNPLPMLLLLLPLVLTLVPFRERNSMVELVAGLEDPSIIGPAAHLVQSIHFGDNRKLIASARTTIRNLLPHLRVEHTHLWTPQQREAFISPLISIALPQKSHAAVPYSQLCEHALLVLKALEQVADEREVKYVRRLADMRPKTPQERQIQQAAQECLPYLEVRMQENQHAQTLLRASAASSAAQADSLLRTTSGHETETAPKELLRPNKK